MICGLRCRKRLRTRRRQDERSSSEVERFRAGFLSVLLRSMDVVLRMSSKRAGLLMNGVLSTIRRVVLTSSSLRSEESAQDWLLWSFLRAVSRGKVRNSVK